jgi:hypothetical protein
MLPAETFAEITTAIAALQLAPDTASQILAAVFAPLLRLSGNPVREPSLPERPRRRGGRRARGGRKRRYKRRSPRPTQARQRARAALEANPNATVSAVAEIAKVSRSTVVNAADDLARESRRKPGPKRKTAREPKPARDLKEERRERAQRFLRDALASGPRRVSDIEEAAAKVHVEHHTLEQARADLGIVTSRANTGGAHAVQWSLPG